MTWNKFTCIFYLAKAMIKMTMIISNLFLISQRNFNYSIPGTTLIDKALNVAKVKTRYILKVLIMFFKVNFTEIEQHDEIVIKGII